MKKLLLLGVLLGTAAQVQAYDITFDNQTDETIHVSIIYKSAFCLNDDSDDVAPHTKFTWDAGWCSGRMVVKYPNDKNPFNQHDASDVHPTYKNFKVWRDTNGRYHFE